MLDNANNVETLRIKLQNDLDALKSQDQRNNLGQFATPTALAKDVVAHGVELLPAATPIKFLDPAIGTGSFYSALLSSTGRIRIEWAKGFEVDPHYAKPAMTLWSKSSIDIICADFTKQQAPTKSDDLATLIICHPPYVRHYHISGGDKTRLRRQAKSSANVDLSGLAGLYCYFLALAHNWLREGGIAGWLIPSEFMDLNYGRAIKEYLLREVTLLEVHRFDSNNVQFDDALVSSAIVWFRKEKPRPDHSVNFTYGGSLRSPEISKRVSPHDLLWTDKWTRFPKFSVEPEHDGYRLGDLFSIKRGLATGDNNFFIVDEVTVKSLGFSKRFLKPVLPSSRYIKSDEIEADTEGLPLLEKRLFLIDCDQGPTELQKLDPELWNYLQAGREEVSSRYLCRLRRHWYFQEKRAPAPILCTYIGRSDRDKPPFRFLLNHSLATATNVYLLLYPKPFVADKLIEVPAKLRTVWRALNEIPRETLLGNGRVYQGGMHKLEPKELANVPVDKVAKLLGLANKQISLQLASPDSNGSTASERVRRAGSLI